MCITEKMILCDGINLFIRNSLQLMASLVHTFPGSHNLDDVGALVRRGQVYLCSSLQLNRFQLLAFPSDDVAMVVLGDLQFYVGLGSTQKEKRNGFENDRNIWEGRGRGWVMRFLRPSGPLCLVLVTVFYTRSHLRILIIIRPLSFMVIMVLPLCLQ